LLAVDGRTIRDNRQLIGIVERLQVDETYRVRVLRNEQEVELSITVAAKPEDLAAMDRQQEFPAESEGTGRFNELGLTAQNVTAELAEQLGTSAAGVVITAVRPGSGAEGAGLESGMLISRVGRTNITNVNDLEQAANAAAGSEKLLMLVRVATGDGSVISRFVSVPLYTDQ